MNEFENKSFVERKKAPLIVIAVILLIIVGVSFAWLTQTLNSTNTNVIVAGNLKLTLNNESPIIKIGGTYGYGEPMTDASGLSTTPYTFTITNTGTEDAYFSLYLDNVDSYTEHSQNLTITSSNRIADSKIKFQLKRSGTTCNSSFALSATGNPRWIENSYLINGTCHTNYPLTTQTGNYYGLAPGASVTYELRLWISSAATNADVVGKIFAAKLRIEATQGGPGWESGTALGDFAYY